MNQNTFILIMLVLGLVCHATSLICWVLSTKQEGDE